MQCDLCNINVAIYDARIPLYGAWGNLCQQCFENNGCKLGLGNGQKI